MQQPYDTIFKILHEQGQVLPLDDEYQFYPSKITNFNVENGVKYIDVEICFKMLIFRITQRITSGV